MRNELFTLLNGDSIQLVKDIDSESQHFSIFSPPFADLYVYSDMVEDLGNCKNVDEFFIHFNFLLPELNRIMIPGRLVAVHSVDLPIEKRFNHVQGRDSRLSFDLSQRGGESNSGYKTGQRSVIAKFHPGWIVAKICLTGMV